MDCVISVSSDQGLISTLIRKNTTGKCQNSPYYNRHMASRMEPFFSKIISKRFFFKSDVQHCVYVVIVIRFVEIDKVVFGHFLKSFLIYKARNAFLEVCPASLSSLDCQ